MDDAKQKSETYTTQPKDDQREWIIPKIENIVEWQSFMLESEQMIETNEKRITAFKEMIEETGPKAVMMYSKKVGVLEQKNLDLRKELKEYKIEGQSQWEMFKMNFKHTLDSLGKSIDSVIKENVIDHKK